MAIQMSSVLLAFLGIFFSLCSLENSLSFQTRREDMESNHLHHHHLVHLSSLFASSSCSSSTKGTPKKASLKVVDKYGPCSQLNHNNKANATTTHIDTTILSLDQERVKYIHSRLSMNLGHDNSVKGLDSGTIPIQYGSAIEFGNYVVLVGLGTPKKYLSLVLDTGSDLTWIQCKPCTGSCVDQQDEIFYPLKSSSYSNITCISSVCTQLSSATGVQQACSSSTKTCVYIIIYEDQSYSIGYFSRERLTVTTTDIIDNFLFGCSQSNKGYSGGVMGLGRHPISFVQQTSSKYKKIFSYCLPSRSNFIGHLTFGDEIDHDNIKYTSFSSIVPGSSFYGINITMITIGGTKLPASFGAGAIIDSGTMVTRLPPTVYYALRSAFQQSMSKYPATGKVSVFDTCYDVSRYKSIHLPVIEFVFANDVTVVIAGIGTIYVTKDKKACLAFTANKDDSDITIFGNIQQRTLEVVYDVGGGRIGFGVAGCK